jgi:hypothetical protein
LLQIFPIERRDVKEILNITARNCINYAVTEPRHVCTVCGPIGGPEPIMG